MNPYSRLMQLNAERLDHCPDKQLFKATGGSVGYDLSIADDVVIPTLSTLDKRGAYAWYPRKPLAEFSEGQQQDILGGACFDPLGKAVLDSKDKVIKEPNNGATEYVQYSFFVDKEDRGMVYCKKYKPFLVRTGFKARPNDPSERSWIKVAIRSSIATKLHVNLINGIGVVDSDYPDEYLLGLIALHDDQILLKGERVAQAIICPYIPATIDWGFKDNMMFVDPNEYGGVISISEGTPLPAFPGELPIRRGGFGSTGNY